MHDRRTSHTRMLYKSKYAQKRVKAEKHYYLNICNVLCSGTGSGTRLPLMKYENRDEITNVDGVLYNEYQLYYLRVVSL